MFQKQSDSFGEMSTRMFLCCFLALMSVSSTQSSLNELNKADSFLDEQIFQPAQLKFSRRSNELHQTILNNIKMIAFISDNRFLSHLTTNLLLITVGYFLSPHRLMRKYRIISMSLFSLAVGVLISDVFLRILPSSIVENDLTTKTSRRHYDSTGLLILIGIFGSFVVEKCLRFGQGLMIANKFK